MPIVPLTFYVFFKLCYEKPGIRVFQPDPILYATKSDRAVNELPISR